MITPEIQQYVNQAIKSAQKNARYDTTNASYHTHNGIDSPILPNQTLAGNGAPTLKASKGTLYVNLIATTTTTRLYINTDGGSTWAYFTASA
jgi:hypothetical protein